MTTLYTAKKYAVPALEKHCVDFLKRHLCADNAFMLLTQARLFDEPQLAALCLETIDKNTPEALAAEGKSLKTAASIQNFENNIGVSIQEHLLFRKLILHTQATLFDEPQLAADKNALEALASEGELLLAEVSIQKCF